jgi:hypothetical protein
VVEFLGAFYRAWAVSRGIGGGETATGGGGPLKPSVSIGGEAEGMAPISGQEGKRTVRHLALQRARGSGRAAHGGVGRPGSGGGALLLQPKEDEGGAGRMAGWAGPAWQANSEKNEKENENPTGLQGLLGQNQFGPPEENENCF